MNKLKIDDLVIKINNMENNLKDLSPVMKKISIDMKSKTNLNFRKQSDPMGNKWLKSKKKTGMTLSDTGDLKQGISSYYGDDFAMIGTNKIYARIHQYGGIIKSRGGKATLRTKTGIVIPQRKFIGMNKKMKERYGKWLQEYTIGE